MHPRIYGAAIYLLFFSASGSLSPYLNLFYQTVGMSKQQIGVLIASATLTSVIAAPLWSGLADALRLHRYLLPLAMFGTLIPIALLANSTTFVALWLLIICYAIFSGPIVALADNSVLEILGDDRAAYGKLRLWGAIGFGVAAWGGGALAERYGLSISFALFIVFMLLCGLVATRLPAPTVTTSDSYLHNLRRLSSNVTWLGFLVAIFLVGIASSFVHNYTVLYVTDLGGGESLYGLSVFIAGLSELPVFLLSARLIRRFTPRALLMLAFAVFAVRSVVISGIPSAEWIILPQLMHGLSFSALWAAAVVYVSQTAPRGLGASAQAAMGTTFFGVAGAVGGLFGANLYAASGPVAVFRAGAVAAFLGLCVFALVELRARQSRIAAMQPR